MATSSDYEAALAEIEKYFIKEPKLGAPAVELVDMLAMLIETYERKHWPIDPPDPVSVIRYRMETGGYTQADLGRVLGSRQRASEILSGKRSLTLAMMRALHREWGIPIASLVQESKAA